VTSHRQPSNTLAISEINTPHQSTRMNLVIHLLDGADHEFTEVLGWDEDGSFIWVKWDNPHTGQWSWSYFRKEVVKHIRFDQIKRD
jgi:hypothetical protein